MISEMVKDSLLAGTITVIDRVVKSDPEEQQVCGMNILSNFHTDFESIYINSITIAIVCGSLLKRKCLFT